MPTLGFLSPGFLLALPLAIVPFLIHFLSRRRRRVVEFSSVSLLSKARRQNVERLRLREILLLILRTLIVLLLVLALSRPLLEGLGGAALADHVPTGVVMVIDATMSMQYSPGGESLFARGLSRAREVLALLGGEDRVRLLASDRGVHELAAADLSPREAARYLERLAPTNFSGSLDACLVRAAVLAREMDLPWKEVHVFTDLREGSLGDSVLAGEKDPVPVAFFTERDPEPVNRFLEDAVLEREGGTQEEKWVLKARAGSSGAVIPAGIFPRLTIDGEQAGMAEVQLSGEDKKAAVFPLESAPGSGRRLMVQIDEDALHADDERYLITGEERPLVVERGVGLDAARLLGVALDVLVGPAGEAPQDGGEAPRQEGNAGVLVTLSSDREGIRRALERGAGLVVFPDPSGEKPQGWTLLHATASGEVDAGEGGFRKIAAPREAQADLPAFLSALGEGLARLPVTRYVRLSPGPEWRELWRLDLENGDPALVGGTVERSRVVAWAIPPALDASELYGAPPFIPLLDGAIRFAAGGDEAREILCGEPVKLRATHRPQVAQSVTVRHPGGAESVVAPLPDGRLVFEDTGEPGFYEAGDGLSVRERFAVNVDTRESLMRGIDEVELANRLAPADVRLVRGGAGLEEAILTKRGGRDITSWLLIAAFVALLAESHIAGRIQRE